jgi:hypothetical protein
MPLAGPAGVEDQPSPTEGEKAEEVSPRLTGRSGSKVAKLALIAMNAARNGDLHGAVDVLQSIHDECVPGLAGGDRATVGTRGDRS